MNNNYAIIYCRVSQAKNYRHKTEPHELSLDVQEELCTHYCNTNNYIIKDVIKEVCSARDMNRMEKLQDALQTIQCNETLMIADITRFSRNTLQGLQILESLNEKNVNIFAINNRCNYNTTQDKHIFRQTLSNSEHESDQISDRVKRSLQYKKMNGAKQGIAKYGKEIYTDENGQRKERINVTENNILKKIKLMLNNKCEYQTIVTALNKTRQLYRGKAWNVTRLKYLVTNVMHIQKTKKKICL